jgi:phosphate-selective porin OprO and OprP
VSLTALVLTVALSQSAPSDPPLPQPPAPPAAEAPRSAVPSPAAASGGSARKTLEEVLKEKGVITEEDYQKVKRSKPPGYSPGKGFTFTSEDGKFSLTLGGYIQPRYSFAQKDDEHVAPAQQADVSEFRVRRAKFVLSGYAFTKDLTYKLQTEFTNSGNARMLDDAYLNYRWRDELQVRGGQDKVPFSRQWLNAGWALSFIERSIASDAFYAGRDIGLMVNGKLLGGTITYVIGGYGGSGQSTLSTSTDNAAAVRLVANPFGDVPYVEADIDMSRSPLLSVGGNYYRKAFRRNTTAGANTNGFATNNVQLVANNLVFTSPSIPNGWLGSGANQFDEAEKVDVDTFGIDAVFKWMGLAIQGEFYYGRAEGQSSNEILHALGGYGQVGYMVLPRHLEAAVRYSRVDPDSDQDDNSLTEYQGALSYYFSGHPLKLQAEFTHRRDEARGETDDRIYRIQAQVMF